MNHLENDQRRRLLDYHLGTTSGEARREIEETLLASPALLLNYFALKRAFECADEEEGEEAGPSPAARHRLREEVAREFGRSAEPAIHPTAAADSAHANARATAYAGASARQEHAVRIPFKGRVKSAWRPAWATAAAIIATFGGYTWLETKNYPPRAAHESPKTSAPPAGAPFSVDAANTAARSLGVL